MRIGIVGAGASATGACLGLTPGSDVTVLDVGKPVGPLREEMAVAPPWSDSLYRTAHTAARTAGAGLFPQKQYFGSLPSHYPGAASVYLSEVFGGLTRFWGACMLPFTPHDLRGWPITAAQLLPHYGTILREVPVAGQDDGMADYFGRGFVNADSIAIPTILARLVASVHGRGGFVAGKSRLALRTAPPHACTYCGHCFYGCYSDAIYSAHTTLARLAAAGRIRYRSGLRVLSVEPTRGSVQLRLAATGHTVEQLAFDRVILCAGCIETTRITAASYGLQGSRVPLRENPMFIFPLLYTGPSTRGEDVTRSIALSNVLLGLPQEAPASYIHMQVYPLSSYIWNHLALRIGLPASSRLVTRAHQVLARRTFIGFLYLDGSYSDGSELDLRGADVLPRFRHSEGARTVAESILRRLSRVLRGSGFLVSPSLVRVMPPGSSAHYAGTLPMGIRVGADSAIEPGRVYIGDSSTFPSLPAPNHTFTIMANAARIAGAIS